MSLRSRLRRAEAPLAVESGELTVWVYVGNGGAATATRRPGPAPVYTVMVPKSPAWLPGNAMVLLGKDAEDEDGLASDEQAEVLCALVEALTSEQARLVRAARSVVLLSAP